MCVKGQGTDTGQYTDAIITADVSVEDSHPACRSAFSSTGSPGGGRSPTAQEIKKGGESRGMSKSLLHNLQQDANKSQQEEPIALAIPRSWKRLKLV